MACWARRSCHVTAQQRSPQSFWTGCFRSVSPMMEKWFVKQAARLPKPSKTCATLRIPSIGTRVIYLIQVVSFHDCRTIRPTLTLSWPWKTGRSRQRFSIFLNFWTSRTKDTLMFSPSTFSSGYRLHFVLTSTINARNESIVFIPHFIFHFVL